MCAGTLAPGLASDHVALFPWENTALRIQTKQILLIATSPAPITLRNYELVSTVGDEWPLKAVDALARLSFTAVSRAGGNS